MTFTRSLFSFLARVSSRFLSPALGAAKNIAATMTSVLTSHFWLDKYMALIIPRSLDSPWLETDPKLRDRLIRAYKIWLWRHLEIDREAAEIGLDGGECDYGLIDPASIDPDLPIDPEWVRDDDNGRTDPTMKTAHQFYELAWKVDAADMRSLFSSSKPHYLVLARAIKWTHSKTEK